MFAEQGAKVAVLSRSEEKVKSAVAQLEQNGGPALGFAADVRDYPAVEKAIHGAAEAFGPLDIVVSGAAGNFLCAACKMSPNAFKSVVDIDLLGTFNVLRSAYDVVRKPGAAMINISAPQSTEPHWGQAHVSAAKAGVDMLTRSLALEWGPEGIRVNAIVPGPTEGTEGMARLAPTAEIRTFIEGMVPLRRFGTKREIANLAVFLAGPGAAYMTGAILYCDGGQVLVGSRPKPPGM